MKVAMSDRPARAPRLLSAWAALLAAALVPGCQRAPREPAAELRPIDGSAFQDLIRSAGGRPLVVNFWATWCEPCREEIPALEALHREMRGDVRVVGVSVDDPSHIEQVRRYVAEQRVTFPQYIRSDSDDETFIAAVDPEWSGAVPATFLYDGSGERAARLVGQQSRESLESALGSLRGSPPPAAGDERTGS